MRYRQSTFWVAGLLVALLLCCMCYLVVDGVFVRHMVLHIALMGPAACLAATWLLKFRQHKWLRNLHNSLWWATCLQITLFLFFHAPWTFHGVDNLTLHILTLLSLFGCAVWFWTCSFCLYQKHYWQSILALLLTGKVFCLVAVLMIFSPRELYGGVYHAVSLGEQQLAGLLMIVACPLSYILAAVVLCLRWLNAVSHNSIVNWLDLQDA